VLNAADVPKDLRWAAATLWAAHDTHIVHYPLRGWKLFNLVATSIGQPISEGHAEVATPEEVLPQFAHYCEKPLKLMRTPKQFTRWMLRYREPVDNWIKGPVALLGDAAHLMLQYMAQGAAMAMEDAVALGVACDVADGDFEKAFERYLQMRLVRASRVHISANSLIGQIFHVPDGLLRLVRNDIFIGRAPERYYDALEWVFAAPDYVREFKASRRPAATEARAAKPLKRAAARKRRPPSRQRS
jgi:salicylate hydroxylase